MTVVPPSTKAATVMSAAPSTHGSDGWMERSPTVGMYQKTKPAKTTTSAVTQSRARKTPLPGLYAIDSALPFHLSVSSDKPVTLFLLLPVLRDTGVEFVRIFR